MKIFALKFIKISCFAILFQGLIDSQSFAKPHRGEQDSRTYESWFGPTIGIGIISGDDFLAEGLHSGLVLGLKGGIATSGDSFRLQGNLGLFHSRIDVEADKKMFQPGEETPNYIDTTYGEAEIIASYLRGGFSFGPIFSLAFGTDTSFGPTVNEQDSPNFFLGFEIKNLRELETSLFHAWSLSALIDANISERDVIFLRFSFEFGKTLSTEPKYIVEVKEKKIIKYKTKYKTKYRDRIKTVVKIKPQYVVDAGVINFATDRYDIKQVTREYLIALASYLSGNLKRWDRIKIKAYSDKRGSFAHNEKLARKRGDAVSSILIKAGLPKARIKTVVKTFEQPVESGDSPLALARNRRVELSISGKNEMEPIKQNILLLQQKHRVPPTCIDNKCK
ncbi:MAG: OmpA family protein [Oligoflexales bacterium]